MNAVSVFLVYIYLLVLVHGSSSLVDDPHRVPEIG